MAGVGSAPRRSVAAEDIRDLQRLTRHKSRTSGGWLAFLELHREMLQRAQTSRIVGLYAMPSLCGSA
jgi:hypothetical protein